MIIYTYSTHVLLQSSQKSASKYIFCQKYEDFSFFDPLDANNLQFSAKKGLSNLIHASIMNKTC